eukprot:4603198-Pleurochrysis_carterae.AAC.1
MRLLASPRALDHCTAVPHSMTSHAPTPDHRHEASAPGFACGALHQLKCWRYGWRVKIAIRSSALFVHTA